MRLGMDAESVSIQYLPQRKTKISQVTLGKWSLRGHLYNIGRL